jgi:hypothetical protein
MERIGGSVQNQWLVGTEFLTTIFGIKRLLAEDATVAMEKTLFDT